MVLADRLETKVKEGSFSRVKVAVFNAYIRFYPTVLGLWVMSTSEVKKTVTLKNEPPKNEPYKIYDRFTSPNKCF